MLVGPGFLIDRLEQVERVRQEVAGAAGGIEDLQVARVLRGTVQDVGRFVSCVLPFARVWARGLRGEGVQEDLVGASHEELALLGEAGLSPAHLVPGPPERVVGQELDDVPWGEELVADGQLAAGARRL